LFLLVLPLRTREPHLTSKKPFSASAEIFGDDAVVAMVDSYRVKGRDLAGRPRTDPLQRPGRAAALLHLGPPGLGFRSAAAGSRNRAVDSRSRHGPSGPPTVGIAA
jgi:hypothetical protein